MKRRPLLSRCAVNRVTCQPFDGDIAEFRLPSSGLSISLRMAVHLHRRIRALRDRVPPMSPRTLEIRDPQGRTHQITIPQALEFAIGFWQAGDRKSAELIYRQAVGTRPTTSEDLHALGTACYRLGAFEGAL